MEIEPNVDEEIIPQHIEEEIENGAQMLNIPASKIEEEPGFNQRINYGDEDFEALMASIKAKGVVAPILVSKHPTKKGHFYVREGHRRLKACHLLQTAGVKVKRIPSVVTEKNKAELYGMMLISNSTGRKFANIEKGNIIVKLLNEGYTVKDIAEEWGVPANHIYFCHSLTELPKKYHKKMSNGHISDNALINLFREYKNQPKKAERELEKAIKRAEKELLKRQKRDEELGKPVDKKEKPKVTAKHFKGGISFASATQKVREALIRAGKRPDLYDKKKVTFLSSICAILEDSKSTSQEVADVLRKD